MSGRRAQAAVACAEITGELRCVSVHHNLSDTIKARLVHPVHKAASIEPVWASLRAKQFLATQKTYKSAAHAGLGLQALAMMRLQVMAVADACGAAWREAQCTSSSEGAFQQDRLLLLRHDS